MTTSALSGVLFLLLLAVCLLSFAFVLHAVITGCERRTPSHWNPTSIFLLGEDGCWHPFPDPGGEEADAAGEGRKADPR